MRGVNEKTKSTTKSTLPKIIKVAVVDDQQLFRSGVVSLLKDYEELKVIIEASNGRELMEQLKRQSPHVVLLDIEMPEMNGLEAAQLIKDKYPNIKVIILTMHNEEEFIFDLITKGAHGFLPKDKSVEEVVDAIYAVLETGKYYSAEITEAMVNGSKGLVKSLQMSSLSDREIEIVKYICQEKTNREIAEILGFGIRTIESYRATILSKTGTRNTAGLVLYALKHRLISTLDIK
jgi:DNA-binding NarL/FixJ family response regulator